MVVKTAVSPRFTLRCACGSDWGVQMLGNLKAPPDPWADVIRTHFRLKAKSIITQLDKWLADDDGHGTMGDGAFNQKSNASSSSNGLAEDAAELKSLLNKLQAGEELS